LEGGRGIQNKFKLQAPVLHAHNGPDSCQPAYKTQTRLWSYQARASPPNFWKR